MRSLPLVDRNMASAAIKVLKQAVKPHIPLIKFPSRGSVQTGTEINHTPSQMNTLQNLVSGVGSRAGTSSSSPIGKAATIDSSELPHRYQRKDISMEEIEYIEKGGPV